MTHLLVLLTGVFLKIISIWALPMREPAAVSTRTPVLLQLAAKTSIEKTQVLSEEKHVAEKHKKSAFLADNLQKVTAKENSAADFQSFCDEDSFALEWADEFNRAGLDTDVWQMISSEHRTPGDQTDVVAGLETTACRTAECRGKNVWVENGKLHLLSERSQDDASKFFTGAVTTKGRKSWADNPSAYRLCVSAKLPGSPGPSGKGIWPAHWMLPDNGLSESCLDEGEMDIMEMINSDGGSYSTYHWMSSWPQQKCADFDKFHKSAHSLTRMPGDWNSRFHEYALERSSQHLAFAVDGKVVLNISASDANTELSHSPFFLILNTAIGGGWPGEPSELTQLPAEHVIDYVRVARHKQHDGASSNAVSALMEIDSHVHHKHTWNSRGSPPPLSLSDRRMKGP
jgi:beta-glucanase (GH16 family)